MLLEYEQPWDDYVAVNINSRWMCTSILLGAGPFFEQI